jgi:hypothetical protein
LTSSAQIPYSLYYLNKFSLGAFQMGYRIELQPGEPIIWEVWDANYNPEIDGPQAAQELIRLMDDSPVPVAVIVDMREANLTFDDLLQLAKSSSSENAPARHPKQRKRVIITHSDIISMVAKGMDHELFGHITLDVVTTSKDALERARQ